MMEKVVGVMITVLVDGMAKQIAEHVTVYPMLMQVVHFHHLAIALNAV
jgi:hypothetical protein